MTKPVPQIPPIVVIVTPDGLQTQEFAIYLQKLEAVLRDFEERITALEP